MKQDDKVNLLEESLDTSIKKKYNNIIRNLDEEINNDFSTPTNLRLRS